MNNLLEAGLIVNTHGIKGEVKIQPWADSPEFLLDLPRIYIDERPVKILSGRVHKGHILATLEGIGDIDSAIRLKNKTIYISRDDVTLEEGQFFLQDIIGLTAKTPSGEILGTLTEILNRPAQDIYVINGEREYLIPDVPEFIPEKNIEGGYITVRPIEGM